MTRSISTSSEDLADGLKCATAEGDKICWEVSSDAVPTFLVEVRPSHKFDPTAPISDLAARLLSVSNGLHSPRPVAAD